MARFFHDVDTSSKLDFGRSSHLPPSSCYNANMYNFESQDFFDQLYNDANGQIERVPWSRPHTNPHLQAWLDREQINGAGKSALVVGCGLGDDAEELARRGFQVVAFDLSETAISWAKQRFPTSPVHYTVMDMFKHPDSWASRFAFVLEINIVQAFPLSRRNLAIGVETQFVAPDGELLVICHRRVQHDHMPLGPPWPMSRIEIDQYAQNGLQPVSIEAYQDGIPRFRAHFRRAR